MNDPSPTEWMIVSAARALAGTRTVLVGVGIPNIACNLARLTVAPDLNLIYESGVIGARPARLPLSIGDPALVTGAAFACAMTDLFLYVLQGGRVESALLGTAQIDRFGNLNTTVIGPYHAPDVRLPGSGGACDISINADRTLVITRLERRVFVEGLDFLTSPGQRIAGRRRAALGIPGGGPQRVITDAATFSFDPADGEMRLESLRSGETFESIQARVGWKLKTLPQLVELEPPTQEELGILRSQLDPEGRYR